MNAHGSFIWYELLTRDAKAAKTFYDDVVGWNIDAEPAPGGMDYRMIKLPEGGFAGGVMQLSDEMLANGAKPMWLAYFGVDDVDAAVEKIVADGGSVQLPAFDIPGIGRLAMLTDPQGVPFYVMRGASDENSTVYGRHTMGHVSWNELQVPDDAAAIAFLARQFGIRKVGAMPMGEHGDYSFLANGDTGDEPFGAVMRQSGSFGWSFYFRVPEIDAAKARVEAGGGTVHAGPMEVPGGEWVIVASDPEGAPFGLVAPAREG